MDRRRFLTTSISALSASALLPGLWGGLSVAAPGHPRLYVTAQKTGTLRSLDEVRAALQDEHARALWQRIRDAARADLDADPLTPATPLPGRTASAVADRNPDFVICQAAGLRVQRHALIHLLTGEAAHREAALRQIHTLFNPEVWPQWLDQAHERFGHPADLRTGMLARDVGLGFDWLYPSLSAAERQRLINGLDRYALQPFLISLEQDPWWIHDLHNWITTIAGGVSVAALALGDAHPQAQTVVDASLPLMDAYLQRYGPEGEYNECPAYANATERPVMFYAALRYASGGGTNPLARWPFPQTCRWTMYLTLPPGRIAALGDSKPTMRPWVQHVAAVASAAQDGILQGYYLHHADPDSADPLELLWYDPSVPPEAPDEHLPLGRTFPAHAACVVSRTSWDPHSTPCVVYGNASREENHEHNDDGQVCIDGYGERLIVDLGPPAIYPGDFFDAARWDYYNASVRGHNVLMFGGRERRVPDRQRGEQYGVRWESLRGRLLEARFDDVRGGWWQADLTPTYHAARRVHRTVIHLLPGIVAVLDEAELEQPDEVSLRWHTIDRAAPDAEGAFTVRGERAALAGRIVRLDAGALSFRRGEHAYAPPYDRDRYGDPLPQPHESHVEARCTTDRCRLLTLFAVTGSTESVPAWTVTDEGFEVSTSDGLVWVTVTDRHLRVANPETGSAWRVGRA
jgi:hypothetical protein